MYSFSTLAALYLLGMAIGMLGVKLLYRAEIKIGDLVLAQFLIHTHLQAHVNCPSRSELETDYEKLGLETALLIGKKTEPMRRKLSAAGK